MGIRTIWAETALTPAGWQDALRVDIGADGRIASLTPGSAPAGHRVGALLPAPANLHSHAFQRAMAGLTERRGPDSRDTFWTWRQTMYRFLDHLTPEDVQAIAAYAQMQMLEGGFAAVAEFHYLHHCPGGAPHDNIAEMSARIVAAADQTGIGLTLLPVLYRFGGCDGRGLGPGQVRFGCTPDQFARLAEGARAALAALPPDAGFGIAPHSLRAVAPGDLALCAKLAAGGPVHMHLAEQQAEVAEVQAALGVRPVEWLLDNAPVGSRWCLIHCTQATRSETLRLAGSGAVVGLCPITESSLGDGIFDAIAHAQAGGRYGIGSDSNIRISLPEELRTLEYSQRLRDQQRAAMAQPPLSTGRSLWQQAATGGAQALARDCGAIAPGAWADLVALDTSLPDLAGRTGDVLIDTLVFAGDAGMIRDVWSAGRHVVQQGTHVARGAITAHYGAVMRRLAGLL